MLFTLELHVNELIRFIVFYVWPFGSKWGFCLFLLIFGCAVPSLHALFSSCGRRGLFSSCGTWASRCSGLSCRGAQALGPGASPAAVPELQSTRLRSPGALASSLLGMCDFPRPGVEPMLLAGRVFTTEAPLSSKFMSQWWLLLATHHDCNIFPFMTIVPLV